MVEKLTFLQKIRPWIPALLWVGVIAWESSGIFTAENTGSWLYAIVHALFGPVNLRRFGLVHALLRKSGHFIGYALLSYFFFRGWRGRFLSELTAGGMARLRNLWKWQWALNSVLLTLLIASLDEFHQTLIPGRTGIPRDVALDTIGGIFAQLVVVGWASSRRQPHAKEQEESRVAAPARRL